MACVLGNLWMSQCVEVECFDVGKLFLNLNWQSVISFHQFRVIEWFAFRVWIKILLAPEWSRFTSMRVGRLSELGTNLWFVYINLPAKKDVKRIFWKKKIKVMAVFRQFQLIFTFKRNHCFSRHQNKARNSKGKCNIGNKCVGKNFLEIQ